MVAEVKIAELMVRCLDSSSFPRKDNFLSKIRLNNRNDHV